MAYSAGDVGSHHWFPDTGAMNHATPDPSVMSSAAGYNGPNTLRVGDGTCLPIDLSTKAVLYKGSTSGGLYSWPVSNVGPAALAAAHTSSRCDIIGLDIHIFVSCVRF
ncbi:PREDICTED: uncharacterized protein LOC109182605 [Ipomoea nil]|uniref:uncharacterized protein LOC109182605 n=1 Tax=Ipomoea nil TaxID=35883 RepID=UPI0009011F3D|nr:PREDICTED: uncharacterized protein LOC109182605 [Ipomoea nil]